MKKLRPVFLAVIIGCMCAYVLFKKVEDTTLIKTDGNAVAVQIGVFTKEENAEMMKNRYGGIVTQDDDLFRVYYSILSTNDNLEFIKEYLNSKGINYYLKRINLKDDILLKLGKYEQLMQKSNKESKLTLNNKLLKLYEAEL